MHLNLCTGKAVLWPGIGISIGYDMTAKIILDLKGMVSPMDLLKCSACLTSMDTGDILEAVLGDADVVENLTAIVLKSSDEIIYRRQTKDSICIGIRKGPRFRDEWQDTGRKV
jgi:TusA-related sulfurtransferase